MSVDCVTVETKVSERRGGHDVRTDCVNIYAAECIRGVRILITLLLTSSADDVALEKWDY